MDNRVIIISNSGDVLFMMLGAVMVREGEAANLEGARR